MEIGAYISFIDNQYSRFYLNMEISMNYMDSYWGFLE